MPGAIPSADSVDKIGLHSSLGERDNALSKQKKFSDEKYNEENKTNESNQW